jgi:hypothetical protein
MPLLETRGESGRLLCMHPVPAMLAYQVIPVAMQAGTPT